MDFIFVYVIKHKWLHLPQFFENICMSLNRDTNNLDFHQSRDHEVSSCIEIANSSSSGEFLMIVGRYHCTTWCKVCEMLHITKCVIVTWCKGRKCVTFCMTQDVWHFTHHKICDVLNGAKCAIFYMWHITWRTMCDMLHDAKCVTCYM